MAYSHSSNQYWIDLCIQSYKDQLAEIETDKINFDLVALLLECKRERRLKKNPTHDLNAIVLHRALELTAFLEWLSQQKTLPRVDIIYGEAIDLGEPILHWFNLSVSKTETGCQLFIYDQYQSDLTIMNVLEVFDKCANLNLEKIYCYASLLNFQTMVQNGKNCSWFALETCFRLSHIDIFAVLKKNEPLFDVDERRKEDYLSHHQAGYRRRSYLYRYRNLESRLSMFAAKMRNIKLIFPDKLPPEMAALFTFCQSSGSFAQLSDAVRQYPISSKQYEGVPLSLEAVIARKHQLGQQYMKIEPIVPTWPTDRSGEAGYRNHVVIYFKINLLNKAIAWLQSESDEHINQIIKNRLKFDKLLAARPPLFPKVAFAKHEW